MGNTTIFRGLAERHGVTPFSVLLIAAASVVALGASALLTSCSQSQVTATVQKATAVGHALEADAASPAGQQILGTVSSEALNLGLAITSEGFNIPADIASVQGAASIVRDYEGLPVAPSAAAIAKVAGVGAGDASVAAKLLNGTAQSAGIAKIIGNAKAAAAVQNIAVGADAITEAVARGFDAVASAKYVPPTSLAGTTGEAP